MTDNENLLETTEAQHSITTEGVKLTTITYERSENPTPSVIVIDGLASIRKATEQNAPYQPHKRQKKKPLRDQAVPAFSVKHINVAQEGEVDRERTSELVKKDITGISLVSTKGLYYLRADAYPELHVKIDNIRDENKIVKSAKDLQAQIVVYEKLVGEAESAGITPETLLTVRGKNPREIIKKIEDMINNPPVSAPASSSEKKTPTDKPNSSVGAPLNVLQHGNGQKRRGAYVELDEPVTDNIPDRPYALHDRLYQNSLPRLEQDQAIVVLDADVLIRCFGVDTSVAHEALTLEDRNQLQNFGKAVFDSLVNNPRIAAIIIPDYIADREVCCRITDYSNGKASAEFLRPESKPGGEYFHSAFEEVLKHAIRRHIDDRGKIEYMCDSSTDANKINPKIIIWESRVGKEAVHAFKKELAQYMRALRQGDKDLPIPGKQFGERVIEKLVNSKELAGLRKLIISADYAYVHGDTVPFEEKPDICHMNLGGYLQSLIMNDIPKWATLSGVEKEMKEQKLGPAIVTLIRDKMRTNFNALQKRKDRSDHLSFVYCDNDELFREATGLPYAGTQLTKAAIVRAAQSKSIELYS